MYFIYSILLKSVVHVPWYVPCAASRVSRVLLVYSMRQCFNMAVLHGHGRGKRLGTCLVLQPCVSCVVS